MKQYINKAAVVAEIEKKLDKYNKLQSFNYSAVKDLESLLNFLDTFEVKEVKEEPVSKDLEKAARDILDTYKPIFSSSTSDGEPIEYYSPGQMRTMFMKGSYWQKEYCLKELMNSDLETAADKYAIKIYNMFIKDETTLNNKEGDEILSDAFKAGAKWQEAQMIGKACEWLEEHKEHPFIRCEDPCLSGYLTDEFIEDFKKTMEDKL